MARTKRNTSPTRQSRQVWRYIKYKRKSSEEDDSRSIKNQDAVLDEYIGDLQRREPDAEFICVGSFCDEDDTGTDSERDGFQETLKMLGKEANMLIVTDMSRLSRDTSESLFYVQKLFVSLDIRFISLQLPKLDSFLDPNGIYSIEVPIQSMFNEKHAADTSEKVRRSFDSKRRAGLFIGAFAPYGLKKYPEEKGVLIIDDEPAQVIRDIRDWIFSGMSPNQVAHKLNEMGVLSPIAYKHSKGFKYHNPTNLGTDLWTGDAVRKVCRNPMIAGIMVQGRQKVVSYKIHKQIKTKPEDWYVVLGKIEPIISKEDFDRLTGLLTKDTRMGPGKREQYLFSGFLRCEECGRPIVAKGRVAGSDLVRYICATYKNFSSQYCTSHYTREDKLSNAVLLTLQKQIALAIDMEEAVAKIRESQTTNYNTKRIEAALQANEREKKRFQRYKQGLFQAKEDGEFTQQEYYNMLVEYDTQLERITASIEKLQQEKKAFATGMKSEDAWFNSFKRYKTITKLDRAY